MTNENNNIMNSSDGKQKVIMTYDSTFLNSDAIFVEYDDVLNCPFFNLLLNVKDNQALSLLFDLSEISDFSLEELYEWYLNRKEPNILLNLPVRQGVIESFFNNDEDTFISWCYEFLYSELDEIPQLLDEPGTKLNFHNIFKTLLDKKMVKRVYVYSNDYSERLKEEIVEEYGTNVKYVTGKISEIIKEENITNNSTFVFSDIRNILELEEANVLGLSSVVVADRYGYNYQDEKNLIVDMERLSKENVFKLDFFNNIEVVEEIEE